MMEVGRSVAVLDPYDWLPGHGENGVELRTQGTDLSVIISYDGEFGELKRELLFKHSVAFYKTSFPGPDMLNMRCSVAGTGSLGSLNECPDSEASKFWQEHFRGQFDIKHYSMLFLSENVAIVVFAEDFALREVEP